MNVITTGVRFAPTFSTTSSWRAFAIINGRPTSICCMHSHGRQDLAENCANKYFANITAPLPQAELRDIGDGLHEARWIDAQNRNITRRFRYLPERGNS